jgi:hypothetical protein
MSYDVFLCEKRYNSSFILLTHLLLASVIPSVMVNG